MNSTDIFLPSSEEFESLRRYFKNPDLIEPLQEISKRLRKEILEASFPRPNWWSDSFSVYIPKTKEKSSEELVKILGSLGYRTYYSKQTMLLTIYLGE